VEADDVPIIEQLLENNASTLESLQLTLPSIFKNPCPIKLPILSRLKSLIILVEGGGRRMNDKEDDNDIPYLIFPTGNHCVDYSVQFLTNFSRKIKFIEKHA
jgi:hypothetical protein